MDTPLFSSRSIVYYPCFCCLQQYSVVFESPPVEMMLYFRILMTHSVFKNCKPRKFQTDQRIFLTVVFLCIENCRLLFNSGSYKIMFLCFLSLFRIVFCSLIQNSVSTEKTIAQRRPSFKRKV